MARTVYSQFLGEAVSVNSSVPLPIFTADVVHRTVMKSLTIAIGVNITPGSASIIGPTGAYLHSIAAQTSDLPVKRTVVTVFAMFVLAPGDTVYYQTEGGWTADFTINGYLLTLP